MKTVLVAAASLAVRMDLDEALTESGISFTTVSSAAEARALLARERVGLLVLDPALRTREGATLLEDLCADPAGTRPPILLLGTEAQALRHMPQPLDLRDCEFLGHPYDKRRLRERATELGRKLESAGPTEATRLLLVEPDSRFAARLRENLSTQGLEMIMESDSAGARAALQEHYVDAVLVAQSLTDGSGEGLCRWIRASGHQGDVPLILLVESGAREELLAGLAAGVDDCITKADSHELLLARLRTLLRRKDAERETRRMREALLRKEMQATVAEKARQEAEARAALLAELELKNRELDNARRVAEAATEAKSAFLASMSHEIRTPMNAIVGLTEMFYETPLTKEQREWLDVIHNSGNHLLNLISDILDFSKIEAGRMEFDASPFLLRQCVEDALDLIAFQAAQRGIELAYELGPEVPRAVIGDVGRVRQILLNYLSNAVKFTERGEVAVLVQATPAEAGRVNLRFTVRDTGAGIPQERIGALFQTFYQLESLKPLPQVGTGLGLAISKRLAELMGGHVSAESAPGAGSSFHLEITVPAAELPQREPHETGKPLRGLRALVVDDNDLNRKLVAQMIAAWGGRAHQARSAREAIALFERGEVFDFGLIDYPLPDSPRLELAWAIHQQPTGRELPLVLVGSINHSSLMTEDFADFVAKPLRAATLHRVLTQLVETRVSWRASDQKAGRRAAEPTTAQRRGGDLPPIRALLAEDNPVNQHVTSLMLKRLNVAVDLAGNGQEAVDKAGSGQYDVIFMDVNMPSMDGLEATRRIRAAVGGRQRPRIVGLTAAAMHGDRERCLSAGMDDYLTKPVSRSRLQGVLARLPGAPAGATPVETAIAPPTPAPAAEPPTERAPAAVAPPPVATDSPLEELVSTIGRDGLGSLLDIFFEDGPQQMAAARDAARRGNAETLRTAAHTMKSAAGYLGAMALSKLCAEIERNAAQGRLPAALEKMPALESEFKRATQALREARRRYVN